MPVQDQTAATDVDAVAVVAEAEVATVAVTAVAIAVVVVVVVTVYLETKPRFQQLNETINFQRFISKNQIFR